jgi:hypothetical protein
MAASEAMAPPELALGAAAASSISGSFAFRPSEGVASASSEPGTMGWLLRQATWQYAAEALRRLSS